MNKAVIIKTRVEKLHNEEHFAQFNVIAKRFNTLIARHYHKKGGDGGNEGNGGNN